MRVELQRCTRTGRPFHITRIEECDNRLEMISADPDPRLQDVVLSYTGYRECNPGPTRRQELPTTGIVLIFDFGPTLRFLDREGERVVGRHAGGFLAGLSEWPVLTETAGAQSGLHVNLTPLGARRLLGLPMSELANRVVGLEEVFGPRGAALAAALRDMDDWPRRFALIDETVARRLMETEHVHGLAATAWHRLQQTAGRITVAQLASELDCSRKHLSAVFRDQLGLTPKRLSRVLRFRHAIDLYDRGICTGWADIAYASGYTDQAHFVREFQHFSGATPTEFLRRRRPHEDATLAG